jgi:hypothetical protein
MFIASKWMELENIILSQVRLRKPKITFSPSYVDYRLKCSNIIGHGSHTKERLCTRGMGKGKETKNLKVFDMLTV